MLNRRTLLTAAAGTLASPAVIARAAETPGVTATSIKIGNTNPHSGPASAYGIIATTDAAYFRMINDQGGINGRKIDFISYDDGYSPPRTVQQTRRLVEQDGVAFIFNGLGTPCQTAVHAYMNSHKIPQLFVSTGADKWGDYKHFPWTMGWQPSYRTEAQIYAKYLLTEKPGAKLAVLYQNDDFGKDYLAGLKEGLGGKYGSVVVKEISYETTDPTIDSQAVALQGSGADALLTAATPKWAAQMIRKIAELNWHPLHFMTNVSVSVGAVLKPAGVDNAKGMITGAYLKDASDPQWANDAGVAQVKAFVAKYMPGADISDGNIMSGYGVSATLVQVLKQCGNDFSRANVMKEAANLKDLEVASVLPGILINTSPTNFHPIRAMQLSRWDGKAWVRFGQVISA
jgi:branched-chain amino acid transport system substrate-binding protein